jgi:hypothetical protein
MVNLSLLQLHKVRCNFAEPESDELEEGVKKAQDLSCRTYLLCLAPSPFFGQQAVNGFML